MITMLSDREKQVLKETSERNNLRYEIRQKKQLLAKMVNRPEMLEETLVLKAEIESLESELKLM